MVDEYMRIKQLKEQTYTFVKERGWDNNLNAETIINSLSEQSLQLLDIFRNKSNKEIEEIFKSLTKKQIEKDLGDLFGWILLFSEKYDIDLSTCVDKRLQETKMNFPKD